jgi:hypothetical protein
MLSNTGRVLVLAGIVGRVQAAVVEHWWNITWTDANLDGVSLTCLGQRTWLI